MTPDKKHSNSTYWPQTKIQTNSNQNMATITGWKSPNKLFQKQPILKERKLDPNNTRREEITFTRLRIGHTRLTYDFILKEEPPQNVHVKTYTQSSTFW